MLQDHEKCERAAEILKAIAHPLRLRIIAILCQAERNVGNLAGLLGVHQAIVSQQLRILRMRNLVAVSRKDGFASYRLKEPNMKKMISCLEACMQLRV